MTQIEVQNRTLRITLKSLYSFAFFLITVTGGAVMGYAKITTQLALIAQSQTEINRRLDRLEEPKPQLANYRPQP
jgi:hypothetical protein